MQKVRVLVVDDSVVIRRMLTTILDEDPQIEVIGHASNGRLGLARLTQLQPDVVVMDIEMPEMDGVTAVRELRKTHPNLPVIMFSTLTIKGGASTLDALSAGASDYVTKPANLGSAQASMEAIRTELVPKVKVFGGIKGGDVLPTAPAAPVVATAPRAPRTAPATVDIVAIGVSTGGPKALNDVIPALPATFPVPVVIVQHMPPTFTKLLAERLDVISPLHVVEAADGDEIRAGTVYIAPGGRHMVVERGALVPHVRLNENPPENSCRPAVDPLFRSVADVYQSHVLAVILTGMGQDGTRGAEVIAHAGGAVFAQDEATSVVWGMPGFIVRHGLADKVLPLDQVAAAITTTVGARRLAAGTPAGGS